MGRNYKHENSGDRLQVGSSAAGRDQLGQTKCCHYRRLKRGRLASQVQVPKKMFRVFMDFYASLMIILELLVVPDTVLALFSSVSSVYLWDTYAPDFSVNLNWTAVSFMLAFPLQNAIREAYRRRESALQALMDFRACVLNVYLANAVWDWPGTVGYEGRWEDGKAKEEGGRGIKKKPCDQPLATTHGEHVKELLLRILDALQDFLFVPRSGHARNEIRCGREERDEVAAALDQGRETIVRLLGRLHSATEEMKAAGMPANEASRINQYNMFLTRDWERIWGFKTYYTPIALRGLLRVMIQILPFFYGPYWLHIARGDSGFEKRDRSIVFATSFSIMLTCLLIAMNNLQEQVENPFRNNNRDTIRVREEINLTRRAIHIYTDDLHCRWHQRMRFDWEIVGESESESDTCSSIASST